MTTAATKHRATRTAVAPTGRRIDQAQHRSLMNIWCQRSCISERFQFHLLGGSQRRYGLRLILSADALHLLFTGLDRLRRGVQRRRVGGAASHCLVHGLMLASDVGGDGARGVPLGLAEITERGYLRIGQIQVGLEFRKIRSGRRSGRLRLEEHKAACQAERGERYIS